MENVIGLIEAQQKKLKENSAPWTVGEQLKDMVRTAPAWAELVAQDLEHGGHTLVEAEKRIKAWADKNKTGKFAFVSPARAEQILRDYFGLPEIRAAAPAPAPAADAVRLEDFF